MVRARSSSSRLRYYNPSYYLKRPKRLALFCIAFVCVSCVVWDRQTLVREHEVLIVPVFQIYCFSFILVVWGSFFYLDVDMFDLETVVDFYYPPPPLFSLSLF